MTRKKRESTPSPLPTHPRYPAGLQTAIWMMPDDDLVNAIDRMASSSEARQDKIGYYLDELDRREQRKLNRSMRRLSRFVAALTVVVLVLSVLSTYAVFFR